MLALVRRIAFKNAPGSAGDLLRCYPPAVTTYLVRARARILQGPCLARLEFRKARDAHSMVLRCLGPNVYVCACCCCWSPCCRLSTGDSVRCVLPTHILACVLHCLQKYGVDLLCDRPLPADRVEGGSSAFGVRRLAGDTSFLSLVEAAGRRMFPADDGVVLGVSRVRALCPKSVGRAAVCQTCLHFQKA
jgi:hypothetical protein